MKTIELVKGKDGVYRQGKIEAKQATFKNPVRSRVLSSRRRIRNPSLAQNVIQELNGILEEISMEALDTLTHGFFRR